MLSSVLNIQYSTDQTQKELLVPLKKFIVSISLKEPRVAFIRPEWSSVEGEP